jgi:peptidoglycan/LPS O-acetylase OafA/YrhL
MESAKLPYRPHIDGLRGIAVLAVLGFHAFPEVLKGGSTGVDIFFVISGFLISSILYADFSAPASRVGGVILNFYYRRVRRIFPALIIVLAACYVMGFVLLLPSELAGLSQKIVASAGFYLNFLLSGREDYFKGSSSSNPLLHLWSLAVEEQFYLLWPLAIWLAIRCRVKMLTLAVFLASCSYFWNAQKYQGTEASAFFLPQMRMWELLIGAASAAVFPLIAQTPVCQGNLGLQPGRRWTAGLLPNCLSILGIGLVGAGLIFIKRDASLPNMWTLLPTVGSACVVCSAGSAWTNRRILSSRVLVWIGLISYPLYLWHWPLLTFAQITSEHPNSGVMKFSILAVSVVLAWLTYRLVERPIRHGRRRRRICLALVGAMAAVAGLGCFTKRANGFPSRYPALISEISTFQYDPAVSLRQGAYFLMGDTDETKFKKDPNEIQKGRPTLYLWGDSHAAALYPGVNEAYGKKYNIVQRTTAGTPPFMPDYFNPGGARQINQFVLNSIVRDRPEYVILEADWPEYEWTQVERTIGALKAAGIRHVILVGPVPQWIGTLPQQLFNYVRRHRAEPVPTRMTAGVDSRPADVDRLMASLAERVGAIYFSPCQILGNKDGFLVRIGDTPETVTTYDNSHLTASASIYLVSHFPKL